MIDVSTQDKKIELLRDCGALLDGHFLLSSGRHSDRYVQCAKLLRYPDKAEAMLSSVAHAIRKMDPDLLVGPAMGGIIVAYELGRQVGKEAIFAERVDNQMSIRRGFEIKPGTKVVICEDVITTGKSSFEVKAVLEELGAEVMAIACIIDRSGDTPLGMPTFSSLQLDITTYEKEQCPLCKQGIPVVKPGSRQLVEVNVNNL